MTDSTNNFNDNPRECLEHYAARRPDSLMGYRPYVDNELTRHFVALGALEWRAIDGVKYCKLTPDGGRMLEEYRHNETRHELEAAKARIAELEQPEHHLRYQYLQQYEQMLEVAEKRIAELEAVIAEVVGAFEIRQHPFKNDIEMTINDVHPFTEGYGLWQWKRKYFALRRLLDSLPDSR